MKSNVIFVLITILFSTLGCNKGDMDKCKDPDAIVLVHDFNPDYFLHVMVYKDFDTMRFLKNNKDTVVFFGDKVKAIDDVIPVKGGCGKESYRAVMQTFKNLQGDSIVLYYSLMLNPARTINQFSIEFSDSLFVQFAQYIVDCDSNITVFGKTYCVGIMGVHSLSPPCIYYAKDVGIVKIALKSDVYERIL